MSGSTRDSTHAICATHEPCSRRPEASVGATDLRNFVPTTARSDASGRPNHCTAARSRGPRAFESHAIRAWLPVPCGHLEYPTALRDYREQDTATEEENHMREFVPAVIVALSVGLWGCGSTDSGTPGSPAPTPTPAPTPGGTVTINVIGERGSLSF